MKNYSAVDKLINSLTDMGCAHLAFESLHWVVVFLSKRKLHLDFKLL